MPPFASGLQGGRPVTLTLLLDLDDTLLKNSINTFLPAYLQAWSVFIAAYRDPQKFVNAMLAGTHQMDEHPRPDCSLREVFDSVMFPLIDSDSKSFQPFENRFYQEIFPTLQPLTQPIPGAVKFVDQAFAIGCRVAIATNPFFPRSAIEQRLEWAGLPVDRYPFSIVPSIDKFHFGKPHLEFFAELLSFLGWPDDPVIMVGNDPDRDILPADQFGLSTFWVTESETPDLDILRRPHARGSLEDLLKCIESDQTSLANPDLSSSASMLAILRTTPAVLTSMCKDLTEAQWTAHPQPGEWCAAEILCHLRDVDIEVNIPRLTKMMTENNPFLPGMDTDRWNAERQYHLQSGPRALEGFFTARLNLLTMIDALQPDSWQRTAQHSIFGRTELSELVSFISEHDRLHIQQLIKVL
jgi:FMN phosphatase YigB (HAD superfamily)